MKQLLQPLLIIGLLCLSWSCSNEPAEDTLFAQFQNPPADARPMVRWWWNGNCVEADEIKRELGVMSKAGIGGVEINSIAMPPHAKDINAKPLQWAGPEWCSMVKTASLEAQRLGMITDLIVGSGWPFGGRFLKENEIMQRLGVKKQTVKANTTVALDLNEYLSFKSHQTRGTTNMKETSDVELVAVKLIPMNIKSLDEIVDITGKVADNRLEYTAANRDYVLVFLYNERNFKSVSHGSPGADGPIMDHYNSEVVLNYLNRLKALEQETGMPLSELVRALFCDSIELGGSNWTDDMKEQFLARNGYDVTPWLPFVVQPPTQPNKYETTQELAEKIKRVQYDYFNTIINVFLERFTSKFQEFCTENGVLCRYQAYGVPYYMGLFQGNMIPDIPESNNWIYSQGRDEAATSAFTWSQGHGYMLWNKAASSAAHITGRKITSCEAMTNLGGVFRMSLETVKQSDDINFITGINHTVLHGYNYSPPEAGFPGWMRYGAYFSEQNSWWSYFKHWADYNARLSVVFQNSTPAVDIAILSRLRDYWGEIGANRPIFNSEPWYFARLWEPISNLGSACDYIHQPVLEEARIEGDRLVCGQMSYKTLWLTDVQSLTPKAAQKLKEFADAGGKVVFIGETPDRSLAFVDAEKNDGIVRASIERIRKRSNVLAIEAPLQSENFLGWTETLMKKIDLEPQIEMNAPVGHVYTMKKYAGDREIFFFANSDRKKKVKVEAEIDAGDKVPHLWVPATGKRFALPYTDKNKLELTLDALESALVVYESNSLELPVYEKKTVPNNAAPVTSPWQVTFEHVNGKNFDRTMDELIDFVESDDDEIKTFAGTVTYSTSFENDGSVKFVNLSNVHQGVTELKINGTSAGMRWYGNHSYDISDLVKEGTNTIEIKLTNMLDNYCMSLEDNPTAEAWTKGFDTYFSSGLLGVELVSE